MENRLRHLQRDERGMSLVWAGIGFMTFLAATTLAIDVGMFMTARSQAQNAADAGALGGATALAFNDYDDRSPGGPAVLSAINTATRNPVMAQAVSVEPSDVTFPLGPGGQNNRVKVNVFRVSNRSNPVATLIGPIFGVDTVDISATATAEASPANAATCVKPFTIPDRWVENSDPPWTPDSTFDRYDKWGNVIPDADVYYPAGDPAYAGYDDIADKGVMLMIRAGTGNNVAPSFYWSWAMPPGNGADWYRDNIENCNTTIVHFGDLMIQEPGNMVGPTNQGIDALLAQDPDASWGPLGVESTMHPSPRVFPIPLYDPDYYAYGMTQGRNADLKVANWVGFFLEYRQGNNVYGRITPVMGVMDGNAGPAPEGAFPKVIRLVE
jgi:Flp pilus assembly protein TadG